MRPADPRVLRCVGSILAQTIIWVRKNPIAERLGFAFKPTPDNIDMAARHITDFSVAGIRAIAAQRPPSERARYRASRSRIRLTTIICQGMAPLHGLRVIDLTRVVAGPFCTMMLGDMGAEVLKIEEPQHGDDSRAWAPYIHGWGSFYLGAQSQQEKRGARSEVGGRRGGARRVSSRRPMC